MAISFVDDSATIGTAEYSIIGDTSSGVPLSNTTDLISQPKLRLNNMAAGDEYQLTIYETVGSTQGIVYRNNLFGAQADPIFVFPAVILGNGYDVTVKKIAGTDRSIGWSYATVS